MLGLGETGFTIRTNLNSVGGADEETLGFDVSVLSDTLCDEVSMIETAFPNVVGGSGKGNDDGILGEVW